MNFFKKRGQEKPKTTNISAGLPRQGDVISESLKAHSQFIKRVDCSQCGAPKSLPSTTAYIYCDYCGSLMDYDFRMANADTNAGLTNTVFHRLMAMMQLPLMQAKARGDRETYRQLYRQVFTQWLQECPMAASPRAKNDMAFREKLIAYFAECAVVKDLDPQQAVLQAQMDQLVVRLQRIPMPGSAWRAAGPFWEYAALFKRQMETTYALLQKEGVLAMDPDNAPEGVPIRMEYSTFCQAWLPHLSPEDGDRLLKLYGLATEYDESSLWKQSSVIAALVEAKSTPFPVQGRSCVSPVATLSMWVVRLSHVRNAARCCPFQSQPIMSYVLIAAQILGVCESNLSLEVIVTSKSRRFLL